MAAACLQEQVPPPFGGTPPMKRSPQPRKEELFDQTAASLEGLDARSTA